MATITDGTSNTIAAGESLPAQRADNNVWQYSANIPAGYGDVRTTTLTAEVKEQSNSIDFKPSDAEAPPEPKTSQRRGRKGR